MERAVPHVHGDTNIHYKFVVIGTYAPCTNEGEQLEHDSQYPLGIHVLVTRTIGEQGDPWSGQAYPDPHVHVDCKYSLQVCCYMNICTIHQWRWATGTWFPISSRHSCVVTRTMGEQGDPWSGQADPDLHVHGDTNIHYKFFVIRIILYQ